MPDAPLPQHLNSAEEVPGVIRPPADVAAHQLAVALQWSQRGFPVIPCSRADKRPLVTGFGRDAAPEDLAKFFDQDQLHDWWTGRFSRAHVGLLTGRSRHDGRGLVVIDLDMKKPDTVLPEEYADVTSGADVLERLAAEAGAGWPEDAYTVLTPSGGVHLYFQQPAEGPLIGCAVGAGKTAPHLGPLIDVRGVGGLVIAGGSYSPKQEIPYRRASLPGSRPVPLPEWLRAKLCRPDEPAPARRPLPSRAPLPASADRAARYAEAALTGETERVSKLKKGGERNRWLYSAARRLGELHRGAPLVLSETVVTDNLLDAARSCDLPGGDKAALKTIKSGWERGLRDGKAGAA